MDKISLDGRVVCVVDDDALYRQYLSALLVDKKLDVIEVADGGGLIDVLTHRTIDCILLDYVLADESGLTLHEHLRGRFRKPPPVIMLTSDASQRTVIKAFRNGINDYVLKRGLRPEELFGAIGNAIARRRQEDCAEEDLSRLKQQSIVDDVTGLFRRKAVEDRLERASRAAARRKGQYAVVVIALNELESMEAQFGHLIADRVLRAAASRLQKEIRETDVCGMWGADSFIYLIEANPDRRAVERLKARLEQALSFDLNLDAVSCRITASVGAAIWPTDGKDLAAIVAVAESATATTKASGTPLVSGAMVAASCQGGRQDLETEGDLALVARQEDRRKERRQRVLKRGQIVINGQHSVVDCTIRDLARDGARLRLEGHFTAPEQFDLMILGSGVTRRVSLRWQRGRELGVQFVG
jgi:diguanylate cyclase (GGDEF)-like protein